MASDFEKPDKVHTLFPAEIPTKMWPLPVRDLLFLGKASEQKLIKAGIKTIGEMARYRKRRFSGCWEKRRDISYMSTPTAEMILRWRGEREEAKGYSAETTTEEDIVTYEQAFSLLLAQCDVVSGQNAERW